MQIKIYEGPEITKENLIKEIHNNGFVVFSTMRTTQRIIAKELIDHFNEENISLISVETTRYNFYMCLVDIDRHNYRNILDAATLMDEI